MCVLERDLYSSKLKIVSFRYLYITRPIFCGIYPNSTPISESDNIESKIQSFLTILYSSVCIYEWWKFSLAWNINSQCKKTVNFKNVNWSATWNHFCKSASSNRDCHWWNLVRINSRKASYPQILTSQSVSVPVQMVK